MRVARHCGLSNLPRLSSTCGELFFRPTSIFVRVALVVYNSGGIQPCTVDFCDDESDHFLPINRDRLPRVADRIKRGSAVLIVRPKIAELVFQVYGRSLHPELFDVYQTRQIERGGYKS